MRVRFVVFGDSNWFWVYVRLEEPWYDFCEKKILRKTTQSLYYHNISQGGTGDCLAV